MSPRRWVLWSACFLGLAVVVTTGAVPALAQIVEAGRPFRDLPPDPIARSARLLGMGRLSLVVPDRDNHIELWDFAGNFAGLYRADSNSVLEFRPNTSSSSMVEDFTDPLGGGERQTEASRVAGLGIEGWRRPKQGTAYGLIGSADELRFDSPYDVALERRQQFSNPSVQPAICGRMPYILTSKMHYAVHGIFAVEDTRDEYRGTVRNGVGEYIDQEGQLRGTPNSFDPDEYFVRRVGGGLAFAYDVNPGTAVAVGGNFTSNEIIGANESARFDSETRERRPLWTGQASMVGRFGKELEWGVDARLWSSNSDATWVYTISPSGGPGPSRPAIAGRGNLNDREESGSRLRARVRAPFRFGELGASFGTYNREVDLTPAPLSDASSFNLFRAALYFSLATGDTLSLPPDLRSTHAQQSAWDAAGGASWKLPGNKGTMGAEFHVLTDEIEQLVGPGALEEEILGQPKVSTVTKREVWEVRTGLEYPCTEVLGGRVGYLFRNEDFDTGTLMNEYTSHAATFGAGLKPAGAMWRVDVGYAFEWGQADYGSPVRPRFTRQQLAMQLRWDF